MRASKNFLFKVSVVRLFENAWDVLMVAEIPTARCVSWITPNRITIFINITAFFVAALFLFSLPSWDIGWARW